MHQPFVAWALPEAFSPPPKVLVNLKMTVSYMNLRNYSITNSKMT